MSDLNTQELLSAYIDGELSLHEKTALEARLENSLELQEELAALRDVSLRVRMVSRPYAPADFNSGVMALIDGSQPSAVRNGEKLLPPRMKRIAAWSSVAVVACLIGLVGWGLRPAPEANTLAFSEKSIEVQTAPAERALRADAPLMKPVAAPVAPTAPNGAMPAIVEQFGAERRRQNAEPVPVVNVSKDEIRRRIDELDRRPQRGNSIRVPGSLKSEDSEIPIIIEFTVVDVMEAMNQVQVLVQRQRVSSRDNQVLSLHQEPADSSELTAVTLELEMDGPEIAAVLNSVAAFDAVMYLEEGMAVQGDDSRNQVPVARTMTALQPAPNGGLRSNAGNKDIPQPGIRQRQFNFQQLVEQGPGQQSENSLSSGESADRAVAGMARQSKNAAQNGVLVTEEMADGADSQRKAAKQAEPSERPMGKGGAPDAAISAGFAAKVGESLPNSGTEGAPRFRAFVHLKQQSTDAKPVRE